MDEVLSAFVDGVAPFPARGVSVVGLGPGDPGLISVKAAVRLRQAERVFYDFGDRPWAIWDLVAAGVERTMVPCEATTNEIVAMIRPHVEAGGRVVYLIAGDPMIFERADSVALALAEAGLALEIVPAPTAAVAAAAYAGIPLTGHGAAPALCLAIGGYHDEPSVSPRDLAAAAGIGTLVLYVAEAHLERLFADLQSHGLGADTPATIVEDGTRAGQRVVTATVATVAGAATRAGITRPAVVFVGAHAVSQPRLFWFGSRG